MADRTLEKLLDQARKAYQKRDKHNGARLIEEILQQDFYHQGVWELLQQLYGGDEPHEEFQRSFTARYYPDRLRLLEEEMASRAAALEPQKRPSFFKRLFGRSKAKSEPAPQDGSPQAALTAAERPAPPSAQPESTLSAGITPERGLSGREPAPRAPAPAQPPSRFRQVTTSPAPAQAAPAAGGLMPSAASPGAAEDAIRVILVDDIAQTRETVLRSLRFQEDIDVVGTASNGLQAIKLVRELRPDVVLMDVNMPDMDGITATATIRRDMPGTEVVILTVQDDMDYIRRAMLAGARDFLSKPPMIDELVQAVQRAGAQARQYRLNQPLAHTRLYTPVSRPGGKIISVYSPRGGSGCTMLAVNLAIGLHRDDRQVVLVDADLLYGDAPVQLNTQSKLSILDLAPRVDELDPEIVNEVLATHVSGVKILHPPRPERAELVTGPQLTKLLLYLSKLFPYVIVDTTHRLSETTLAALDVSDLILLVSTLDIPSISRTRSFLELSKLLNLKPERIMLAVNQFDPRVGIGVEKLPHAFGKAPAIVIPMTSGVAIESINRGTPILIWREASQMPIGKAIRKSVQDVRARLREIERTAVET